MRAAAALLGVLLLQGCSRAAEAPPLQGEVLHSILAVGDTGRTTVFPRFSEGQVSVALGMAHEHEREPAHSLLLLGDNFYWQGLTQGNLVDRLQRNIALPYCPFLALKGPRSAELASHCEAPGRHPVRIFAVLGNHDLGSQESVTLQREVVPEFVSNWQMAHGLVETVELGHGISLILFESELLLTQQLDVAELSSAIAASKGPWRIVAAHRPLGMGERGAPAAGGFPAIVLEAIRAAGRPVHLYLAGHEHNLQLLSGDPGGPHLIAIGGAGSRASTPLAPPLPATRFGAQRLGFMRIDLLRTRDPSQEERLVLSFFASPRFPVLAWGAPERLGRWSVGLGGEVREEGPAVGLTLPRAAPKRTR